MTLLQICAATILFHEYYYYSIHGVETFSLSFMPSLGLRLRPKTKIMLHIAISFACVGALLEPSIAATAILFSLFLLYLANHSWRISNHLMIVFFAMVIEIGNLYFKAIDDVELTKISIFGLLVSIYLFGFVHKLNHGFFDKDHSSANEYLKAFIIAKIPKLCLPTYFFVAFPFFIVAAEAVVFLLLLLPGHWFYLALWIAIFLHFLFGITGNTHFSVLMLLLIASVCGGAPMLVLIAPSSIAIFLTCICLALACQERQQFERRFSAAIAFTIFGGICGYALISVWSAQNSGEIVIYSPKHTGGSLFLCLIFGCLIVNCLSPYFGKTEFSLAMFSNLRPELGNHLFIRSSRQKNILTNYYYELADLNGLGLLRFHRSKTVRSVSFILCGRKHFYYNARFLNEVLILLSELNSESVQLKVRKYAGDAHQLLGIDDLLATEGVTALFNLYPPYLAKDGRKPYMG